MIYFMQPTDGGPVKIGFSNDVDGRRQALEFHYRRPLAVLATMEGGRDEERRSTRGSLICGSDAQSSSDPPRNSWHSSGGHCWSGPTPRR